MDTQTYTKPDLLLRILRYPLVSMLVLYFSLYHVNASGVIFMVTTS